jgi:diaminobutyrate-2-oxoglutarate transaminase
MLSLAVRDRTRVHFSGPTGADAVDGAIKLCKSPTRRDDVG